MAKNIIKTLIIAGLFFGLILGIGVAFKVIIGKKIAEKFANAKITVSTQVVKAKSWQPHLEFIGSLQAINGVNVSSEVSGKVVAIYFKSGQLVQKGQALLKIDDTEDRENLKNYQAQLVLYKSDFKRKAELFQRKAISKSDYDEAKSSLDQTQALVNKAQDAINKKNITAPFAGKIGIRQVALGQYLNPGDSIASLQSLTPLYANFSVPEQYLPKLSVGQEISVSVDAWPKQRFFGKITALDSNISTNTRNISVQATIPNLQTKLYPGNFADVFVYLPEVNNVVTVPQTAIDFSLYGDSVFVIKSKTDKKTGKKMQIAQKVFVKLGEFKSSEVAVLSGVKAGDVVVTAGQFKLTNGAAVVIDNSVTLTERKKTNLQGA